MQALQARLGGQSLSIGGQRRPQRALVSDTAQSRRYGGVIMAKTQLIRRFLTAGATGTAALLLIAGCSTAPAEAPADAPATTAEETQPEAEAPAAIEVELDDPTALGDYGTRWVQEFGLPKIRNYTVNAVLDQSEASGFTILTAGGGSADQAVVDEYGELLVQMGWDYDGVRDIDGGTQEDWHVEAGEVVKSVSVVSYSDGSITKFIYQEF